MLHSIAGAVFGNQLEKQLGDTVTAIPPDVLKSVRQSVTAIFSLSEPLRGVVITAYVDSLKYAFILIVPSCAMISISGLFVKNWNLKEDREPQAEHTDFRCVKDSNDTINSSGPITSLNCKESTYTGNSRPTMVDSGLNSGSSLVLGSGFSSNVMDARWYTNAINNV
jgi:hypothetical protein